MRPRTEAALALGLFGVLVALVAAMGAGQRETQEEDPRASSFLTGPLGARALAEGLRRTGVEVIQSRRPMRDLAADSGVTDRRILLLLNPALPMSGAEQTALLVALKLWPKTDLLLAGPGTNRLMQCFGYTAERRPLESVVLRPIAGQERTGEWPGLSAVLSAGSRAVIHDSSRAEDAGVTTCEVPAVSRIDTLLTATAGRVVALRLWLADQDQRIILVSDAALFRNRPLRETPAGPFALGLLTGAYDRVIFDELHQGFGQGGSLFDALMAWSGRSPWGWAAWQLAAVGVLVLAAGAVRFGPVRRVIPRRRRSPLEHVRALATALAAAKGHDVAIGAIVQGLNRRLHPASRQSRVAWREWVHRLANQLRSPRAQEAARTLQSLTRPGQPSEGVLRAANAVEDVWEELRP